MGKKVSFEVESRDKQSTVSVLLEDMNSCLKKESAMSVNPFESESSERFFINVGKKVALSCYIFFLAFLVFAVFSSVYRAVTKKPDVMLAFPKAGKISESRLQSCIKRLRALDRDLEQGSVNLWHKMRHGSRYVRYLSLWKDFSKNWRLKMENVRRQCSLHGESKIVKGFDSAIKHLALLQRRQEAVFHDFFYESRGLFREVRNGMHLLKEEVR